VAYCYLIADGTEPGRDTVPPLSAAADYDTDAQLLAASLWYRF
jgi:hypothetical protein